MGADGRRKEATASSLYEEQHSGQRKAEEVCGEEDTVSRAIEKQGIQR